MSGASERANGRASGPVLQSVFLVVLDHSVLFSSSGQIGDTKMRGNQAVYLRLMQSQIGQRRLRGSGPGSH